MPPMRKGFQMPGAGPGMAASATGEAAGVGGMPQLGRMNARPPLPMGGNGQPQPGMPGMPGMPQGQPQQPPPPMLGAGGPTSPFNIQSMLNPKTSLQPETANGMLPAEGEQGMGQGRSGSGQSMPMVMLQLMKALGHIQ